jgi:hypothetical protein
MEDCLAVQSEKRLVSKSVALWELSWGARWEGRKVCTWAWPWGRAKAFASGSAWAAWWAWQKAAL